MTIGMVIALIGVPLGILLLALILYIALGRQEAFAEARKRKKEAKS